MSMSFCGQALACEYLVKENAAGNIGALKPRVYMLPEKLDQKIAALQLKVNGIKIDKLTPEQIEYLKSWREGTE
jgi:adenosylhomocysteinase